MALGGCRPGIVLVSILRLLVLCLVLNFIGFVALAKWVGPVFSTNYEGFKFRVVVFPQRIGIFNANGKLYKKHIFDERNDLVTDQFSVDQDNTVSTRWQTPLSTQEIGSGFFFNQQLSSHSMNGQRPIRLIEDAKFDSHIYFFRTQNDLSSKFLEIYDGVILGFPFANLHPLEKFSLLDDHLPPNCFPRECQQEDLRDAYDNLQRPDGYEQTSKQRQLPLYLEILATLLAGLIAWWDGWLAGSGNRWWGGLISALGLGLLTSAFTAIGFCDPRFWRPYLRILRGQNPFRYEWGQQSEYQQPLTHAGNVSQ